VGNALVDALKELEQEYTALQAEIAAEQQRVEDSIATYKMSQGTGVQP
jgi:hypothetical protein